MTPHELMLKTVKDLEERRKKRERDANSYSIENTLKNVAKRNKGRYGKKASRQV